MSNVVSASDPLTSGEVTLIGNLQALATSGAGFAIAKTGINTFANVSTTGGGTGLTIGTTTITSGTTGRLLYDNAGVLGELDTATYPSITELSYVKGVTSGIQSQINAKGAGTITGSGNANEITYFTAGTVIGSLAVATYPSLTELSYAKGVTSAIQTQFTGKQASSSALTSVAGLTYVSASFVKMTAAGTFGLDTTVLGSLATQSGTFSGTSSGTNTGDNSSNSSSQPLNTNLTSIGGLANAAGALTNNGSGSFSYTAAGVGDMILSGIQTVTGLKTFDTSKLAVKGSSTGVNTIANANASVSDYINTIPAKTGTFAMTSDITGTNSGTNTGDNSANTTYTIGSQTQAYNANLTAINQALTTTSSPSFTTVTAALTGTASGNLVSGGALGTPSSGTLTSATGLPAAGVVGTA